jgi:hypothetical protein
MDGRCSSRSERNENATVDGEGRGQAAVETGCQGGQGSPRAVAPSGWNSDTAKARVSKVAVSFSVCFID